MKYLYLTFLFLALSSLFIGFSLGMNLRNEFAELWIELGLHEDNVIYTITPIFIALTILQFGKLKEWLIHKQYLKDIENIGN